MKGIIVPNAAAFLKRGKRAMIIASSNLDAYITPDGWENVRSITPGTSTTEVVLFNRHRFSVGDVVSVKDEYMQRCGTIQIESIHYTNVDALTPDELQALGYDTHEELYNLAGSYRGRNIWYLTISPVKLRIPLISRITKWMKIP